MHAKRPGTVESEYVLDTKLTTLVPLLQQGENENAVWRVNGPVGGGTGRSTVWGNGSARKKTEVPERIGLGT